MLEERLFGLRYISLIDFETFPEPFSLTARGGREDESAALISASSLSIALRLSSTFMRPLAGPLKN